MNRKPNSMRDQWEIQTSTDPVTLKYFSPTSSSYKTQICSEDFPYDINRCAQMITTSLSEPVNPTFPPEIYDRSKPVGILRLISPSDPYPGRSNLRFARAIGRRIHTERARLVQILRERDRIGQILPLTNGRP